MKRWHEASDLLLGSSAQTYEYARCKSCRVLFLVTRPLPSELGKIYPENYVPYGRAPDNTSEARAVSTHWVYRRLNRLLRRAEDGFRQKVETYYANLRKGAVFLDFGCGAGDFLNRMRARGYATIGMDFSDISLGIVRGNGHRALPANEAGWGEIADGSLEFVRMNHVIEHLYEPGEVLKRLYSKMSPGGVLHISAPNPDGLSARLYGRHWHGLDCPRHAILLPPKVLSRWLNDLGFRLLDVLREPVTKDLIRSKALMNQHRHARHREDVNNLITREDERAKAAVPVLLGRLIGLHDRFHTFVAR